MAHYLATHPLSSTLWGIRSKQRSRAARGVVSNAACSGNLDLVQWLVEDGWVGDSEASFMLEEGHHAHVRWHDVRARV